jgi:hypothetical protein
MPAQVQAGLCVHNLIIPAAARVCFMLVPLQEIVGLGLANFAGSAFNAYSTTGSFSRSAVNYDSGAALALHLPSACMLHCRDSAESAAACSCSKPHLTAARCTRMPQKDVPASLHWRSIEHVCHPASCNRRCCCLRAGAKTGLSGFVTGCVVGLVLLVMTPVFEMLPLNVMGAIVVRCRAPTRLQLIGDCLTASCVAGGRGILVGLQWERLCKCSAATCMCVVCRLVPFLQHTFMYQQWPCVMSCVLVVCCRSAV